MILCFCSGAAFFHSFRWASAFFREVNSLLFRFSHVFPVKVTTSYFFFIAHFLSCGGAGFPARWWLLEVGRKFEGSKVTLTHLYITGEGAFEPVSFGVTVKIAVKLLGFFVVFGGIEHGQDFDFCGVVLVEGFARVENDVSFSYGADIGTYMPPTFRAARAFDNLDSHGDFSFRCVGCVVLCVFIICPVGYKFKVGYSTNIHHGIYAK